MRKWFQMRAAQAGPAEILIYDEIGASFWGEDTVTAKDFDAELKALGDVSEIHLRVNSPGGDVFDGLAIYNMLKMHPAKVTATIDGIAASAASLIVMAADEIVIPQNSFMLIHEPRTMAWGTAGTLLAAAADLERMTTQFVQTYATRTGGDAENIKAIMLEDRLMASDEAMQLGFADRLAEPVKMAASFKLDRLPEAARAKIKAMIEEENAAAVAGDEPEAGGEDQPVAAAPAAAAELEPVAAVLEATNVVNIEDVRAQAESETAARAAEIADLCALAGKPSMASEFIASRKSVAAVRAELIEARASEPVITSVHAESVSKNPARSWDKIISAINSRVR